jgi:flavin-dependent dehydrogenase
MATEHGVDALYAPRRHILDWLMIEAAIDSGVEFRGSSRVTGLLRGRDRRVCGVVLGHEEEIDARVVIGADGTHSKVADLVAAPVQACHRTTNAVHYAYFSGVEHEGFWFQFTPGVNAGLIQTNGDVMLAFVGRRREHLAAFRHDPEEDFFRLLRHAGADLARVVEAGTRVGGFRGTPGLAGYSRKPWGPGWALVGDAGYTKDPISAHGISDALRDAELCARAVDRSLRHVDDEAAAMSEYWRVRDQLSSRIYREAAALAAYRWDAAEASARMRAISESVRDECAAIEALPPWAEATSAA